MKIIGALLARDEAAPDRYLERCVKNALEYCDLVVVLDDGSTDQTALKCAQIDAERVKVTCRDSDTGWWGHNEVAARRHLWDLAAKQAGEDGWIYVFDADHELKSTSRCDLLTLCGSTTYNAWSFRLYDLWDDEDTLREDNFWQAHLHPRPWLVKAVPQANWNPKAIHAGHIPHNYPLQAGDVPGLAHINHLGYVRAEHRKVKMEKYLNLVEEA
jgi:hypothetical protein